MARALVTGASGLVGSWLVRALVERGDEVVVVQRGEPSAGLDAGVAVLAGDIRDAELMARAGAGCELAFHLAGQALVQTSSRSPAVTFDVNVRGTWTVLDACLRADVQRVLVASSPEAYGPSRQLPFDETQPLLGNNPYGSSKAAAEVVCGSFWRTYGLPVCITRCANTYGGGDTNRSRLVPDVVHEALAGRRPQIRTDGSARRDFLYVADAVRAMLTLADADATVDGEAFNVGGPQRVSVLEIVRAVCAHAGVPFEPVIRDAVTADDRYLDSSKLARATAWEASWSVAEGIGRTVEWYASRLESTAVSGHSKWASIKHKKAIVDSRRGQQFTKLARAITVAARSGGGDPESNAALGNAVQKAKDASMPKDNIERAIAKGTGAGADADAIEEVLYEGYGPGGVALLIEALTDNRNRTGADVRHLLSKHDGNLGEPGSVAYMFNKRGIVVVDASRYGEDDLLVAIEAGAEDISAEEDGAIEIVCEPTALAAVRSALEGAGVELASAEVTQQPTVRVELDEATATKLLRLIDALEENDDVGEVHANFDVSAEILERIA